MKKNNNLKIGFTPHPECPCISTGMNGSKTRSECPMPRT